jgi:hypothetical protein
MADRLVKNARLARSGVYEYAQREVADLGLPWPPPTEIGEKNMYRVYRPANVLASAVEKGMFTRMPLTRGHPKEWVDPTNFRNYTVGYTGDKARIEWLEDAGEVVIASTLTMADEEAIDAYDRGVVELSPGYKASFAWRKGAYDGKSYDAVMTSVVDTNHLALVNRGRGGAVAAILDHGGKDVNVRKVLSNLWWKAKKKFFVKDGLANGPASEVTGFRAKLSSVVDKRATTKDEDIGAAIDEVKSMIRDLPSGEKKDLLGRYLDDMKLMKEEPEDAVREAQKLATELFDKLDQIAMEEGGMEDEKPDEGKCEHGKLLADCKDCRDKKTKDAEPDPDKKDEEEPKVKDEPEPPVAPPPATPKPAAPPAAPAPAAPAAPAAESGGPGFWMKQLATLLQSMMNDPAVKAMIAPPAAAAPAAPGAAPAAPPAPAAPKPPAAVPPAPPKPAGEPPAPPKAQDGKSEDEMPSLTALISSSGAGQGSGQTLEGIVNSIHGKKG